MGEFDGLLRVGFRPVAAAKNLDFRNGDHIDLWDKDKIAATTTSTPFEKAENVWFWELP